MKITNFGPHDTLRKGKSRIPGYARSCIIAITERKIINKQWRGFAPIIKEFLESALAAEMEVFLDEDQRADGNKRNGKGSKTLKTIAGEVTIDTPADRHSNFEPEIVKSVSGFWQTIWLLKSFPFTVGG